MVGPDCWSEKDERIHAVVRVKRMIGSGNSSSCLQLMFAYLRKKIKKDDEKKRQVRGR